MGNDRMQNTIPAFSPPPRAVSRTPDKNDPNARTFGQGGRYHVVAELGRGGFATVYKAYDHRLAKYVAVKSINISDIPLVERAEYLRHFDTEAKTAARLDHPGVVTVLDYDPYAEEPFLVMPLVDCGTLRDLLSEHPRLPWQQVVDLGIQVAEALEYAHTQGIQAHRDIKPANIFCTPDGRYKVGDFGIAHRRHIGTGITRSTFFSAGTPRYMAPEQINAPRSVDGRTDLFSLCVCLYEALTGKPPFRGVSLEFDPEENPTAARKIVEVAFEEPVPIRKLAPDVPLELARIIEKGLQRDPKNRFRTCAELAAALRRIDVRQGLDRRVARARVLALILVGILGGLTYTYYRELSAAVGEVIPVLAEFPGQARDIVANLRAMLPGSTVDPLEVEQAQQNALRAEAEPYAPLKWRAARAKHEEAAAAAARGERAKANSLAREAVSLYAQAASEAWEIRIRQLRDEATAARQRALGVGIDYETPPGQLFAQAEEMVRRSRDLARQSPAEAVAELTKAVKNYDQAAFDAAESSTLGLRRRSRSLQEDFERIPKIENPPPEVATRLARVQEQLPLIEQDIVAQAFDSAGARIRNAEAELHNALVDTALELRRRVERARQDAQARTLWTDADREREQRAEDAYNKAAERLIGARTNEEFFNAVELLQTAHGDYSTLRERFDKATLLAAQSLKSEAEQADAPYIPKSRQKFEEAKAQLATAHRLAETEPEKATQAAKRAALLFAQAKAIALETSASVRTDLPQERERALDAQRRAEGAGVLDNDRASDAYWRGIEVLRTADATLDDSIAALAAKLDNYRTAIRHFEDSIRLALRSSGREAPPPAIREPERRPPLAVHRDEPSSLERPAAAREPFSVKQVPPPTAQVPLVRGESRQFFVKTTARGPDFVWYFDGKPIPHAAGYPGLELVPPPGYSDGIYSLRVRVIDTDGREVEREWTIRLVSDSSAVQ